MFFNEVSKPVLDPQLMKALHSFSNGIFDQNHHASSVWEETQTNLQDYLHGKRLHNMDNTVALSKKNLEGPSS